MHCHINEKLVYPIEKKRVVGANMKYQLIIDHINQNSNWINNFDLAIWTLTPDDYIIQGNSSTGKLSYADEQDYFCFICY